MLLPLLIHAFHALIRYRCLPPPLPPPCHADILIRRVISLSAMLPVHPLFVCFLHAKTIKQKDATNDGNAVLR